MAVQERTPQRCNQALHRLRIAPFMARSDEIKTRNRSRLLNCS